MYMFQWKPKEIFENFLKRTNLLANLRRRAGHQIIKTFTKLNEFLCDITITSSSLVHVNINSIFHLC